MQCHLVNAVKLTCCYALHILASTKYECGMSVYGFAQNLIGFHSNVNGAFAKQMSH